VDREKSKVASMGRS